MKDLKQTSVFISLILRHKPETIGISLDEHGWASVGELIDGINKTKGYRIDMETLEEIVRTDNKQRYSFNSDKTLIRANQGHSVNVDVELKEAEPPEQLFHGTGRSSSARYLKRGLSRNRDFTFISQRIRKPPKRWVHGTESRIFSLFTRGRCSARGISSTSQKTECG